MIRPDLSLPDHVLEMDEYRRQPMDGKPLALYTIAREAASDLNILCEKCDEKCDDDVIKQTRPAPVKPKDRFVDKPLQQVVAFHRELIRGEEWDKLHFAVVTSDNWAVEGIYMVTLGFDAECKPDAFFLPVEDVGITFFINLQVGTTDWEETRCGYEDFNNTQSALDDKVHDHGDISADDDHNEIKDNDSLQDISRPGADSNNESSISMPVRLGQEPCFLVYNGTSPTQSSAPILDVLDSVWQTKYYKSGEYFVEGRNPWRGAIRRSMAKSSSYGALIRGPRLLRSTRFVVTRKLG